MISPTLSERPQARVIRSLRQWIEDGAYDGGQPLPSEQKLSEQLGVSRGTVRRALAILDEEGMLQQRNGRARVVASQSNGGPVEATRGGLMRNSIAVLTPYREPVAGHHQDGWVEFIAQGTQNAIRAAGLHAVVLHPDLLRGGEVQTLIADRPRGVIISDLLGPISHTVALVEALREGEVPAVVYSGAPEFDACDRVVSDHEAGAYELTRFLIGRGRTRILPVWSSPGTAYWFIGRRRGYERAMLEAGLPAFSPVIVPPMTLLAEAGQTKFESSVRYIGGHLIEHLTGPNRADALMCATDRDVFGTAAACRLFGLQPNTDVDLVGYDNYWRECEERAVESTVPLATVDKCNRELGAALVQLLMERIQGALPDEPQCREVTPRLVVT